MTISSAIQNVFGFLGSTGNSNRPDQPTTNQTSSYVKIGCRVCLGFATLGISEIVRYAITTYQATYGNSSAKVEKHRVQFFNKEIIESDLDRKKISMYPGVAMKALNTVTEELMKADMEIEDPQSTLEEALQTLKKDVVKLDERLNPETYCKLLYDSLKLTALQRKIEARVREEYEKNNRQIEQKVLDRAIIRRKKLITALGEVPLTQLKNRCDELSDYVLTTCFNIEKEDSLIDTILGLGTKALSWAFNLNSYQTNPTIRETVGNVLKKEAEEKEKEEIAKNKGRVNALSEESCKEQLTKTANSYFECIKDVGTLLSRIVTDKEKCLNIITSTLRAYETLKESAIIVTICDPSITSEELLQQLPELYDEMILCLITSLGKDIWEDLSQREKDLYLRALCGLMIRKHEGLASFCRENQLLLEDVKEQLQEIQDGNNERGETSSNAKKISNTLKLVSSLLKKESI